MSARRSKPSEPGDVARSAVPLALIILAAAFPVARPFVLAGLIAGTAVAIRRDAPVRWAWAAPIPVAVSLCWGLLPVPAADPVGADCASLTSPTAVWRAAEATAVLGALALVLGPIVARPFFGPIAYDATVLGAIAPALVFAVANGAMEEIAYRGALLGWSARVIGVPAAVSGRRSSSGSTSRSTTRSPARRESYLAKTR